MRILILLLLLIPSISSAITPLDTLGAGRWTELPNTKYSASGVAPSPAPCGVTGSVVNAWSSAAYDQKRHRLYLHSGGHADYAGNEIVYFHSDSLIWQRVWGPTTSAGDSNIYSPNCGSLFSNAAATYLNGDPRSVHIYDGMEFLIKKDRLLRWGGSKYSSSGGADNVAFEWNPNDGTWAAVDSTDRSGSVLENVMAYDPVTGHAWGNSPGGAGKLWEYDPEAASGFGDWTRRGTEGHEGSSSAAIDPVRRKFITIGQINPTGPVGASYSWNIDGVGTLTRTRIFATGDTSIITRQYPGFNYDPVADRMVAYGGGGDVFTLNMNTLVWTKHTSSSPSVPPQYSGGSIQPFGKFAYIPEKNVYLYVPRDTANVWAYKLPVITRVDMHLKEWRRVALADTDNVCTDGSCKHLRFAFNPDDGRVYECGGDYWPGNPDTNPSSFRQEVWSYSILNDDWILESPYCVADPDSQIRGPDETGWSYDLRRKIFWLQPGFTGSPINCSPDNTLRDSTMFWDPSSKKWHYKSVINALAHEIPQYSQYDSLSDALYRFHEDKYYIMHPGQTPDPVDSSFSFTGSNNIFDKEYTAYDPKTRTIWLLDPGSLPSGAPALWKFDIATRVFTQIVSSTPPDSTLRDQSTIYWDSTNEVLLWPQTLQGDPAPQIVMWAFHPDTEEWESIPIVKDNHTSTILGRSGFYDPYQNVLAIMGVNASNPEPYMFFFRYGNGVGTAFIEQAPEAGSGL